jgi:hypothetical protein
MAVSLSTQSSHCRHFGIFRRRKRYSMKVGWCLLRDVHVKFHKNPLIGSKYKTGGKQTKATVRPPVRKIMK